MSTSCQYCNTPFITGQPQCSCADYHGPTKRTTHSPSMSCMWCNTPFDTIGQPMCSCAIMRVANDVNLRLTADRLLEQRLSTLEQRVANLEGRQWHVKPADIPPTEVRIPILTRDECGNVVKWGEYVGKAPPPNAWKTDEVEQQRMRENSGQGFTRA